jgi:hypothetical protein
MRIVINKLIIVATFCAAALTAAANGQQAADASSTCGRTCLIDVAEKYLAAMVTHDPAKAPFAPKARFTQQGVQLKLPDGLWRTATGLGKYRIYVADPRANTIGFFATALENGAPVIVSARLEVVDGKITKAETEVTPQRVPDGKAGLEALPDTLKDKPRPQFEQVVPQGQRLSRERLIDIANLYWSDLEANDGNLPSPFAADCQRMEGGRYTTNVPPKPRADITGANLSCTEAFGVGFYREDNRVRSRRFLAVDTERNLVFQAVYIDHDATVRTWKLKTGRELTSGHTAPWTWEAMVVIQIDKNGKISQIEATPNPVPYGMRSGWSDGEARPTGAKGWKE